MKMKICPKCKSGNINTSHVQEGIRSDADTIIIYTCTNCKYSKRE